MLDLIYYYRLHQPLKSTSAFLFTKITRLYDVYTFRLPKYEVNKFK